MYQTYFDNFTDFPSVWRWWKAGD